MVRVHPGLLACDASTDREGFLQTQTAVHWQELCQTRGAWEYGVEDGGSLTYVA